MASSNRFLCDYNCYLIVSTSKYTSYSSVYDEKGSKIIEDIALEMEKLLIAKVEAVNIPYLNAKNLLSSNDLEVIAESGNPNVAEMARESRSLTLTPDPRLANTPVSHEFSTVQVPTNVYDRCLKWPTNNAELGIDTFDCRVRSWYLMAATCPKNVIILLDVSGSMQGQLMQIAKSTVKHILNTLDDDDYFNLILFSNTVRYIDGCFNQTMMRANIMNKEAVLDLVEEHKETKEKANFGLAFEEAFLLLKHREESERAYPNDLCNKAILLITDGVPEHYSNVFEKYNWPSKPTRVFTFLLGHEVGDTREVRWMACANNGYYSHIHSLADVQENVQNYIKVLSRPMVINRFHNLVFSSLYQDHMSHLNKDTGLQFMTSVAIPVFDTKNETHGEGNLLGVMGTDIPVSSFKDLAPSSKLGANGFAFMINENGYVLLHPDFKPSWKTSKLKANTMNPFYRNIDLTDVFNPDNKDQFKDPGECDSKKELFTNLVHDCYHINNISKRWGHFGDAVEKRNVTTVQSDALEPDKLNLTSFGVKLLFFATRNGLTKYRSSSTDATGFITNNTDTLDAVYYRRAMEGVEMLEGQPRYRYTYSVLLNRAFSNVSTMVTIVAPVARAENNMRSRLSVAGVVGMQMKYEALSSRFLQETSYGPVNCATNGFKCYLVDNQGYIVASKTPKDQVGKFFGDVENSVMLQLLINGVFYGHEFTDYQALCDIKESQTESNAASMLLNPIKSLIRGIVLLFTEFVIMISEFSLSSIINNIRGDDSLEYDHHDLNHNCSSFREEYDQSEKSLSEQLAYNQQVLMLCANSNSRGKVVSQKPCHKTFMLYRANLSMVTLPFLGNISGCKYTEAGDCHSPDVPDVDDIDRRCPRIQKDKLNISYIYRV
ncbi:voltage-dependent calcium channel subunit alpha-2/delta-3-like [Dreissena polymorpha]|uniref:voltage-dependent calcium channel subunit alpha-2/delta-3-like n=1 Tax=Dreissena polymorpha TaxID=45954 RepID=UPI002264092D|nr:voltage-dependent calcium channel subunit alpha-2/delta-3-like [Dreissena polymorpha]